MTAGPPVFPWVDQVIIQRLADGEAGTLIADDLGISLLEVARRAAAVRAILQVRSNSTAAVIIGLPPQDPHEGP